MSNIIFNISLHAAIGVQAPLIVKGTIEYINTDKNFIKIGNSKYYYLEDMEDKLENFVKETVKLKVIEKKGKYFILNIITGYKYIKNY